MPNFCGCLSTFHVCIGVRPICTTFCSFRPKQTVHTRYAICAIGCRSLLRVIRAPVMVLRLCRLGKWRRSIMSPRVRKLTPAARLAQLSQSVVNWNPAMHTAVTWIITTTQRRIRTHTWRNGAKISCGCSSFVVIHSCCYLTHWEM